MCIKIEVSNLSLALVFHRFVCLYKAKKMELFQSLFQYLEFMGIYSLKTHQPQTFNMKILFVLSSIALLGISVIAFVLIEAETVVDFGICFYGIVSDLSNSLDYMIIIWRMPIILKLIGNCEKFIEMSK